MSAVLDERPIEGPDPIDALIPPPRPWWFRLITGALTVGVVGTVAVLWGFGFLSPRPECCGSGSTGAVMALSPDGQAVTIEASLYNSSGRELMVESAQATLPGAEVIGVAVLDPENDVWPTSNTMPFPGEVTGRDFARFLVTFVPTRCTDDDHDSWGTLALQLDLAGWWSLGRRYEVPVLASRQDLNVLPPEWVENPPRSPLAAACALLGR
jgi:hypothetical protein